MDKNKIEIEERNYNAILYETVYCFIFVTVWTMLFYVTMLLYVTVLLYVKMLLYVTMLLHTSRLWCYTDVIQNDVKFSVCISLNSILV